MRSLVALVSIVTVLVASCGVGRSTAEDPVPPDRIDEAIDAREGVFLNVTFDQIDQRLDDRVAAMGLPGAALVVESVAGDDHLHLVGDVGLDDRVPLAESSMWSTAAVLLTLVDDATLTLDEPIGRILNEMTGRHGDITVRQLLSHTSGLPHQVDCAEPTPVSCDAAVAAAPLVADPGEAFSVTDLDAHVAARVAETATGRPWAELFAQRIADPTGMTATTYADASTTGGLVAVDGLTTPNDFGRFLAVIRDGGRSDGASVLTEASIRTMLLDQTAKLDTHAEPWVAETGVPTYGLGVWRDRLRGDDAASVVSAPNRYGFYPFVDAAQGAWGVVVVVDRANPRADAVSASALITQLTAAVLRRSPD